MVQFRAVSGLLRKIELQVFIGSKCMDFNKNLEIYI